VPDKPPEHMYCSKCDVDSNNVVQNGFDHHQRMLRLAATCSFLLLASAMPACCARQLSE
jgi:hypothetical protein